MSTLVEKALNGASAWLANTGACVTNAKNLEEVCGCIVTEKEQPLFKYPVLQSNPSVGTYIFVNSAPVYTKILGKAGQSMCMDKAVKSFINCMGSPNRKSEMNACSIVFMSDISLCSPGSKVYMKLQPVASHAISSLISYGFEEALKLFLK